MTEGNRAGPGDQPEQETSGTSTREDERARDDRRPVSLRALARYFLHLGAFGFGGPIALAGYMRRDLAEERRWITAEEFQDGLAIAQTMPGPLAAQLAMWIGFIRHGVLGATVVGVLFVLPPFLIVVAVAALYVAFAGLPAIRALFYGIGPAAIAIIALAAWKLAKSTDGRDARLWATSLVLLIITVVARAELAWLFVLAGIAGIAVYAPPGKPRAAPSPSNRLAGLVPFPLAASSPLVAPVAAGSVAVSLTLFFLQASLFTFGSGLAIVPFLYQGVVVDHRWLTDRQFLDAVAMGIITPGPVVITAAFIGYLVGGAIATELAPLGLGVPLFVAGLLGAALASFGVFFPVWAFNVVVGHLFLPHRNNPQVRGFVKGATAAAVGAIGGAAIILGEGAIVDLATAGIFLAALVVLSLKKLKEPYVVGLAGLLGLLLLR